MGYSRAVDWGPRFRFFPRVFAPARLGSVLTSYICQERPMSISRHFHSSQRPAAHSPGTFFHVLMCVQFSAPNTDVECGGIRAGAVYVFAEGKHVASSPLSAALSAGRRQTLLSMLSCIRDAISGSDTGSATTRRQFRLGGVGLESDG
eukprot:1030245-Rhodomonas_salina.2